MRRHHHKTLKFHLIYTIVISLICVVIVALKPDIYLAVSAGLLILYVGGNGIIHTRKNELSRDSLLEYVFVAVIALVLLGSALR